MSEENEGDNMQTKQYTCDCMYHVAAVKMKTIHVRRTYVRMQK